MMRARQRRVDLQHFRAVRVQKREKRTCMRERMTWYGYVEHSAASFDAPDMTVYAVLDYYYLKVVRVRAEGKKIRTSFSSSVVHARPSFATRRRFRSNAQPFIFSYPMNCSAPLLTPNNASEVPR
jgi:hypothetical protein